MKTVCGNASIIHLEMSERVEVKSGNGSFLLTYEDFANLAMAFRQGENCGFPRKRIILLRRSLMQY